MLFYRLSNHVSNVIPQMAINKHNVTFSSRDWLRGIGNPRIYRTQVSVLLLYCIKITFINTLYYSYTRFDKVPLWSTNAKLQIRVQVFHDSRSYQIIGMMAQICAGAVGIQETFEGWFCFHSEKQYLHLYIYTAESLSLLLSVCRI